MIRCKCPYLVLVCGLAVAFVGLWVPQTSSAQVPDVGPGGPVVWVTDISINPQAPSVGSTYTVTASVYSRHNRPLVIRGGIAVPKSNQGADVVTSSPPDTTIYPNRYVTLTWRVYCGMDGGQVNVWADIIRETR